VRRRRPGVKRTGLGMRGGKTRERKIGLSMKVRRDQGEENRD
jgi:hypothetical protein